MKCRWIIRSFFIGLLLLCLGSWLSSYLFQETLSYHREHSTRLYRVTLVAGTCAFYSEVAELHLDGFFDGWEHQQSKYDGDNTLWVGHQFQLLGFGVSYELIYAHSPLLLIPLWFPTAICAALLCFSWRKTRQNGKGCAFPVEQSSKEASAKTEPAS
jgi:hypothetical protein